VLHLLLFFLQLRDFFTQKAWLLQPVMTFQPSRVPVEVKAIYGTNPGDLWASQQ
jgi:hypothetical protein